MPGEVVLAKAQLDMDSTAFWGELVLLRSHWVKSVRFCVLSLFSFWFFQCGKRKRHHTEGLVWLKSSGGCELWQHSLGLSPPASASWAAPFPDCCVRGAARARGSKMKLWRGRAALAAFTRGCSSTGALSPRRMQS